MIGLIIGFYLFGCQNYNTHIQTEMDTSDKLTSGIDSILSEIEIIDVKYKEVWRFEPYSKIYYIEPENWGTYGLEDSAKVASITGLDHMTFADDEQVVFLQTFNYQVCNYIEGFVYTIASNDQVRGYIYLINRNGEYIGTINDPLEEYSLDGMSKVDTLKKRVLWQINGRAQLYDPQTYMPRFCVGDLNQDGYVDMYYPSAEVYLWNDGEFGMCSEEEAIQWKRIDYCSQKELEEQERMNIFIEEHVSIEKIENRYVMYAQFHDISNAERINEQIRKLAEENKDYYVSMSIDDIIYVGEKYLVVLMRTRTSDGEYYTEPPVDDGSRYLTFDLKTGNMITLKDILGENYAYDDMTNLMWKAYENKMNEVPDQYSKELFDEYYARVLKEYNEDLQSAEELMPKDKGNRNPVLEDYAQCYFTDDGMVVVYGCSVRFGWPVPPVNYYLNERLEMIEPEEYGDDREDVIEHFCSWEEIYDEAEG